LKEFAAFYVKGKYLGVFTKSSAVRKGILRKSSYVFSSKGQNYVSSHAPFCRMLQAPVAVVSSSFEVFHVYLIIEGNIFIVFIIFLFSISYFSEDC